MNWTEIALLIFGCSGWSAFLLANHFRRKTNKYRATLETGFNLMNELLAGYHGYIVRDAHEAELIGFIESTNPDLIPRIQEYENGLKK